MADSCAGRSFGGKSSSDLAVIGKMALDVFVKKPTTFGVLRLSTATVKGIIMVGGRREGEASSKRRT